MTDQNDNPIRELPQRVAGVADDPRDLETLGPPGVLPSQEAVIALYGPEPVHEAQAIVDALTKILDEPPD